MKIEKKNIVVQENGIAKNYSVLEIETEQSNGDKTTWIPADRFDLSPLDVVKNGHYSARNYNTDGFNQVSVNIELPYSGVTRSGIEYEVYADTTGKPHISVKRG